MDAWRPGDGYDHDSGVRPCLVVVDKEPVPPDSDSRRVWLVLFRGELSGLLSVPRRGWPAWLLRLVLLLISVTQARTSKLEAVAVTPPPEPVGGHYNPVFVTVLPHERRARHPYQFWIMVALLVMPLSQIILGLPDTASVKALPPEQVMAVNVVCMIAAATGIYAAFIPERIIRLWRFDFDATWSRLVLELAGQVFLMFIWVVYVVTIFSVYPLWTKDGFITGGLTMGGGLAFFLGVAASHRSAQIILTLVEAFRGHKQSAIVGIDTLKQSKGG
jgi:hypothetical protein